MRYSWGGVGAVAALLASTFGVHAQQPSVRSERLAATASLHAALAAGSRPATQAFFLEAAGGTVGSLLGFGAVYLSQKDECDVEDLGCNLENAFTAIAIGTATSAAGTYLAGRLFGTQPSGLGATLGAIAGVAAGIGTWHLFTEELDLINKPEAAAAVYVVTQGLLSALGSRLVRALR